MPSNKILFFTSINAIFLASFLAFTKADYNIQLDLSTKQVIITSGDNKITTGNASTYFTGQIQTTNTGSQTPQTWNSTWDITVPAQTETFFTWNILNTLNTWNELDQAIYRMFHNWLTMYDSSTTYRPNDLVTREEAAKLIWQLFQALKFTAPAQTFNCSFADEVSFNDSLNSRIQNVCQRWIFRWNDKTHEYMPHDNLTKGQILAVLTRILEWKVSNENASPRRIEYYVKMRQLGITNETNLINIDKPLTRWETALLINRFKNLIINPDWSTNLDIILSQISWDLDSIIQQALNNWRLQNPDSPLWTWQNWSGNSLWTGWLDLDLIAGNQALIDDPEFNEAIRRMKDKWITNYAIPESFMPFQTVTREQMAKMLASFAKAISLTTIRNEWICTFSDVPQSSEYFTSIQEICSYGVMNWTNNKFNPKLTITKAEFITMLVRLVEWKSLNESKNPRWTDYYQKAIDLSLISAQDTVTFNAPIARYEVAIFFYRLKTRLTMYNNLNNSLLPDEIIKTLEDNSSQENPKSSAKIYIDVLALNNSAFKAGYLEIFWDRYQIKKLTNNYFNVGDNSFVWYWEVHDMTNEEKIWNISFTLTNWALTEWSLRFSSPVKSYHISRDLQTSSRYRIRSI